MLFLLGCTSSAAPMWTVCSPFFKNPHLVWYHVALLCGNYITIALCSPSERPLIKDGVKLRCVHHLKILLWSGHEQQVGHSDVTEKVSLGELHKCFLLHINQRIVMQLQPAGCFTPAFVSLAESGWLPQTSWLSLSIHSMSVWLFGSLVPLHFL